MEESLLPPAAEGNIFDQFDVHVTGELLPGGVSIFDGYFCRLPPCRGEKRVFERKRGLIGHRRLIHSLPHEGTDKIPEEYQIRQWLRSGKPRPYEIPQRPPVRTKSRDPPAGQPGPSLLSKLLHCKPDTESELQPASLESNIYEQFNVRPEPGEAGGSPYVGFVCLLSPCQEKKVCVNTYEKWRRHRRRVHNETEDDQRVKLPDGYEIREWVILNKPRPYEVPVSRRAYYGTKERLCSVDPDVFAEFDVGGTVEDEKLRFICLLHPCKERGATFQGRKSWRNHRVKKHMFPKYEDGEYTLPSGEMIKDWMNAGKPPHYNPQRRVQTIISVDSPCKPVKSSTEVHNRELDPTPSNVVCQCTDVGNEVDAQKSRRRHKESTKCRSGNQYLQGHHQKLHTPISLEGRPSKSWARLGKFRPPTTPTEIPRESHLRGRRPRNADAAGCSSDTERTHHQKKKRQSCHGTDNNTDRDSSDLVAVRDVARGEDPSGGLWEHIMQKTNPTPPSEDTDVEFDDWNEDVDVQSVDQTVEDPNHDYNYMEEYGEEPPEDFVAPADAPEEYDAEMAEVDEDPCEEFEAPGNVLPSHPELQNIKVVGHSSVQSQDFQGVTDEQQQNSTAEMDDADEEAPKDSVAAENVFPSLQNSTAEMGEVEEEEPEDFVAPENALTAFTYSQPRLWEYSNVQPQDFQGDVHETLPNPTAEMDEVDEEAPEDAVAMENALSSLSCLQQEFGVTGIMEHDNVLPQQFQVDIDDMLPKTQMTEFGEAHEEFIYPSNLNPSVQSDVSEQIALSPLWHLDGDSFECLPQDILGENWPNSSKEDNLKYSAEMAEIGEEVPEETVGPVGNLSPSVQSESSEQNKLSSLRHYFRDALQFSPEDSPGETYNNRTSSSAEMAKVGEDTPEGFVAPGNFVPWIPLIQSEEIKLPSLEGPIDIQAAPIQEFVPRFHMDPVFIIEPNAAGMAEVVEEAPEVFVAPGNFAPRISLMQSDGTMLPCLEGPIDIQTPPIQESVPLVHMDPVFVNELNDAGMSEVGQEALEEFAAPGNLVPWLPSNQPQETGKQLNLSSLYTNANSQDPRNIQFEPIIQEYSRTTEFINMDIASMNEPAVVVPLAPPTQPEGTEIGSIFMEGSAGNSREIQVDLVQELTTIMDMERAFESEPDLPLIDVREENPEEFFTLEALVNSPRTMQQIFSPENSKASNNFPAVPVQQTDPLIDMASGFDYELSTLSQPDEMPAWWFNYSISPEGRLL